LPTRIDVEPSEPAPTPCVIASNPALCLTLTETGKIEVASQGFWDHLEQTQDMVCTDGFSKLYSIFGNHDWPAVLKKAQADGATQFETWASRPDGTAHRVQVCIDALDCANASEPHFFVYASDRDPLYDAHDELLRSSLQDPLTELFNRRYLETTTSELIQDARSMGASLAILVLDLDDFKKINDGFGHHVGDLALQHVAKAISSVLPLGETVARYGGDEFVVVLSDSPSEKDVHKLIADIQEAVSRPFRAGEIRVKLSLSIGVGQFPEHGVTLPELMQWADASMYEKKRRKQSGSSRTSRAVQTERHPNRSHHNFENIVPHYQPIVELGSKKIVGFEALCRLKDGQNVILPIEFLPTAEASGGIGDLDRKMISRVCEDISSGETGINADLSIAVNLSATTLNQPDLLDYLLSKVEQAGLNPSHFCIELTESAMLLANDPGRQCLFDLDDLGFQVALDDFGTGFSSLALLKDLPISRLKLDRSFVANLNHSTRDRKIIESVLTLCQSLETTSVMEGIETQEQAAMLRDMGADYGQGFYFSPAMSHSRLETENLGVPA